MFFFSLLVLHICLKYLKKKQKNFNVCFIGETVGRYTYCAHCTVPNPYTVPVCKTYLF